MTSQPSKGTELFHKAEQAFTSRNFEYAKVLYHSFLEITPGHHEARYKLHTAALRCGAGTVVALRPWSLIGAGIAYLKATWYTTRNQWARAVAAWEGCLLVFPRAAFLHLKNASCLSRLGWTQAEIDEYKILRTLLPRDIAPLRELGRLYYEENRLAEAREAYEALLKIQPRDPKAPSELRKIDAQMTIDKGGWQQSGTYRDKIRDEDQATLAEQKSRLVRSKADIDAMLNSLQGQRIQNPKDIGVLREIAKLHSMGGNVEKAKEILREALEIAPRDFYLTQAYGELELAELQQELKKLRDHATQRPQDPKLGLALEKGLQAHRATLLKI
jgi:tetratricopeptide (TPR) repeat protein